MGYIVLAVLTILLTLTMLAGTKIPAVVMLLAATLASCGLAIYARIVDGYWGKFWVIALVFSWFCSAIISLAFIGLGRWLKWQYFLSRPAKETNSAL